MITVITSFQFPKAITREQAQSIFIGAASKYLGVPGLIRKYYVLSDDGCTGGGVYLWNSRSEAEAMYTESWRASAREKYGADPSVSYFESPVVVDNLSHEIISDR